MSIHVWSRRIHNGVAINELLFPVLTVRRLRGGATALKVGVKNLILSNFDDSNTAFSISFSKVGSIDPSSSYDDVALTSLRTRCCSLENWTIRKPVNNINHGWWCRHQTWKLPTQNNIDTNNAPDEPRINANQSRLYQYFPEKINAAGKLWNGLADATLRRP